MEEGREDKIRRCGGRLVGMGEYATSLMFSAFDKSLGMGRRFLFCVTVLSWSEDLFPRVCQLAVHECALVACCYATDDFGFKEAISAMFSGALHEMMPN
ncbi:hypothetical protein V6N13_131522 [Hibiscus sabdariffa]